MGPVVLIALVAAALAACGTEPASDEPATEHAYADVVALFDQAIAPTCSLNNGVCHNSNSYPDLHTVANLVALLDEPCNVEQADPTLVHDACEPAADHLVIASAGIDARIVRRSRASLSRSLSASRARTIRASMPADAITR